jgi:hypothetical protein
MGALDLNTKIVMQDGKMFVGRSQDCSPIAEDAKRRHNAGEYGSSDMKHAARIPNVIIEQYMNENGVSFAEVLGNPQHMKRIVEDPKNSAFRIWKGRL